MSSPPPVQFEVEVADEPMDEDATEMKPADRLCKSDERMCLSDDECEIIICEYLKYTLPARADAVVELWRTKMAEGVLSPTHFQDHWRVVVPRVYSPQPNRTCLDWSFDEQLAWKLLMEPLEQFVWGSSEGSPPAAPRRSTLCGRVFKQGEPAYSCRECGMDNTCVLCVECFKVSPHRHHKYKMGQSGGGGCCDCGDTEAWKRDPFCQLHAASGEEEAVEPATSADVIERMKIVASVCLSYCLRLLTHDHAPGLPNDLRLKDAERDLQQILDQPDCYCTVLYNDETHTFEQVIGTLTRVMKTNHRDAVELVTLIDREGRALVKCNLFQVCDKLKSDIEVFTSRHGASLKVLVMHAHVIAHQHFAMKLLNWIQKFVSREPALRLAVSQVALGLESWGAGAGAGAGVVGGGGGVAAAVMQNDARMWKAARAAWHRLLIATTLMDYSTKRAMAILFTKNYGSILKDFVRDDHDHSFSISSLSVQLYTTPTLAHHLIAHHDALYVVLNTFLSECKRRLNNGRLEFDRAHVPMAFKRAQFILYDVKYLLGAVPPAFDEDLRKGFLHGLSLLLNLLVMMQGMDSIVRQLGQHMEYEPEWESAFNLHVKLAHSITLALEWCAVEEKVAAAAYWMALRRHSDTFSPLPKLLRELGNQSALVIPYDVSTEPVSIHRPLSRFIAGLYLQLHRHGLSYHSKELDRPDKPKPSPEELIVANLELHHARIFSRKEPEPDKPKPTPEELIEPVLQTMAMIAQVHSGMWRRNGFALLNQLYFYHNVKCRAEMLDRDVVMLQIGASLIESNEFIIHVLYKFRLLEWAHPDFEVRSIEDDTLRHTVSMLEEFLGLLITVVGSRYVPGVGEVTNEDRTKKEIIQMLCVKPMPHSELNRSLPEDQLHETGLEAVIHEVADFVKPTGGNVRGVYKLKPHLYDEYDTFFYHYTREELSRSEEEQRNRRKAAGLGECCPPPPLPRLAPPFRLLANLLQSDAALHVLACVLQRALDLRARSFSETQVHKALHLMGYALRDEESGHYEFLAFSERAARCGLLALLQRLAHCRRLDAHRPLARWVLAKMKSLVGQTDEGGGDAETMDTDLQEKPASDADAEKKRRAKMAAEQRAKVMAQMQSQQNKFISQNATLFNETNTEVTAEEQDIRPLYCGAALGVWGGGAPEPPRVCIMCQEEARVENSAEGCVLVAYVQQSTVLAAVRGPAARAHAQPHVSSCGHVMHARCCTDYLHNVLDRENKRPYRMRQPASFDVEKHEYLCPLCERLCNTCLPLVAAPPAPRHAPPALPEDELERAVPLLLAHQVREAPAHVCDEVCEEMHCQARALSVGPAGSAASEEEGAGGGDVYVCTNAEGALPPPFLAHFPSDVPEYHAYTKVLLQEFSQAILRLLRAPEPQFMKLSMLTVHPDTDGAGALYRATWYSVASGAAVLAAERRALLAELPARLRDPLHALVRLAAAAPALTAAPRALAHHALAALRTLETTSPTTHAPFATLVPLVLAAPALFARPGPPARPAHLARLYTLRCLRAQLTRALLALDLTTCGGAPMDEDGAEPAEDLAGLLPLLAEIRRGCDTAGLNPARVWAGARRQCRNFLRCCCLLFHFLSDVPPTPELTVVDGDTWDAMCQYLDLPRTFAELLAPPAARAKVKQWSDMSDAWFAGDVDPATVVEPEGPPRLVPLPEDFSELMNVVSEFSCPNSEREDSKNPTMCLVCGQILCSQSYCCQAEIPKGGRAGGTEHVGAGVAHAAACGAGTGAFLRVRDCELLLLSAPARGARLPAPYLDSYGETDQGLRRGNPLSLCAERYDALRVLWLSHGIAERIARTLDTHLLVATAWQNL